MNWFLIQLIYLYRRLVPAARRRCCLFRVSCSESVLRAARERGFLAGVATLRRRTGQCRSGYQVLPSPEGDGYIVRLADGTVAPPAELSPLLFPPLQAMAAQLSTTLGRGQQQGEQR